MIDRALGVRGACFKIVGEWDFCRRDELQALLQPAESLDDVTLDLSEMTFLDASVLGSLVRLRNRVLKHNSAGKVWIVAASPAVACLFEMCGLQTLFGLAAPITGLPAVIKSSRLPMIRGTAFLSA
jgi:anti-anti-sigma factor